MRILHVVDAMERGGITTWLIKVFRRIDRGRFLMDFLVHTERPGAYDDEVKALGGRVIPNPHYKHPVRYAHGFKRIMATHGPYHAVHSHCHAFSGFVLVLAGMAGVPMRVAHSHSSTRVWDTKNGLLRRGYLRAMSWGIRRYATHGLAAGGSAANALFGPSWETDGRWRVMFCGTELEPFREIPDKERVRADVKIPRDARVVGHVGRFTAEKNHAFLLEVFAEALRLDPHLCLLLVGDGPLLEQTETHAARLRIRDKVFFTGSRPDVPELMAGAMDLFLFPSLSEGLGLALVEAQAAGLPSLVSDAVPPEADPVKPLVRRLALSAPATVWAKVLVGMMSEPPVICRREALKIVESGPFNINASVAGLEKLYSQALSGAVAKPAGGEG